jgi:hypothetical protein
MEVIINLFYNYFTILQKEKTWAISLQKYALFAPNVKDKQQLTGYNT